MGATASGTLTTYEFDSFDGLTLSVRNERPTQSASPLPTLVFAVQPEAHSTFGGGGSSRPGVSGELATAAVEVRNTGATSTGPGYLWTARRTYPLLGESLPERQVSDLLAAITLLRQQPGTGPVAVYGQGYTAPLAVYAAILDPQITEVVVADCPASHEDPKTPEFPGVLRVGDLPQNLALVYPRTITFVGKDARRVRLDPAALREAGSRRPAASHRQHAGLAPRDVQRQLTASRLGSTNL